MKKITVALLALAFAALIGRDKEVKNSKINVLTLAPITSTCDITSQGIGKILLKDSKESIFKKIPSAKFENSSDGEGVAWLITTYEGITVLVAEENFSYLQVENDLCKTKEGVSVGMKVEQIEKIYGKAIKVTTNDSNAEQVVFFEKAPVNISFRGYDLGDFEDGKTDSRSTQKINKKGIIELISVSSVN